MQDRIFYMFCFGFITGVLLRSFVYLNLYITILFLIISFSLLLLFSLISKNKYGIIFSVLITSIFFGILRFSISDTNAPEIFETKVGKEILLNGKIIDQPTIAEQNQKIILETKSKIKILITTNLDTYNYGDSVELKGKLEKPENFMTDQGKVFDYVNYLKKDKILYVMRYPKINVLSQNNGNLIKSLLFRAKDKFLNKINLAIRSPESLLMAGLVLGEKSSFDESMRQSFVNTGTIHIIALSGYNVTIVSEWIMKILSAFPVNIGLGAGIISILLFVLMTGGSSTAIRAGIMASLALFARLIGRNYDVTRALILAAVVMILINPFVLAFDVSFQLSFIATVAVIFFAPKIEKHFLWVTTRFGLRDIVSVTCAAYIFVLPFILYKMGNLSLVALPANILVLPFIPTTMILGFLTGLSGTIWYFLSVPFGYLSFLLLHYELSVISFFSNIPFASLTIPNFPLILTAVIYVYFINMLFSRSIKSFFGDENFSQAQFLKDIAQADEPSIAKNQ